MPEVTRMTLQLCVLEHEPETGLGAFAAHLEAAAVDYELVKTTRDALPEVDRFDGAIALGGSLDVYDPRLVGTRRWIRNAVLDGLPFLGVCLGGQLLASALGGVVRRGRPEVGLHDVFLTDAADHDPALRNRLLSCENVPARTREWTRVPYSSFPRIEGVPGSSRGVGFNPLMRLRQYEMFPKEPQPSTGRPERHGPLAASDRSRVRLCHSEADSPRFRSRVVLPLP
jgi:hypothetical protein